MNTAQNLIITIGQCRICTVGGLIVGFEGTWEFTEAIISATKDVFGTHSLVGIAMFVEITYQRLSE